MDSKIINLNLLETFTYFKYCLYKGIIQSDSFKLATVSENTILTILKYTKRSKTADLNNLSGRFLKDGAKVLAKSITELCNLSISSGKFSDSCKIAKVKPKYKKDFLTEASHYRPISLLPLISKLIEKLIHHQTSVLLNSRNLLYSYQNLVFAKINPLTSISHF